MHSPICNREADSNYIHQCLFHTREIFSFFFHRFFRLPFLSIFPSIQVSRSIFMTFHILCIASCPYPFLHLPGFSPFPLAQGGISVICIFCCISSSVVLPFRKRLLFGGAFLGGAKMRFMLYFFLYFFNAGYALF